MVAGWKQRSGAVGDYSCCLPQAAEGEAIGRASGKSIKIKSVIFLF